MMCISFFLWYDPIKFIHFKGSKSQPLIINFKRSWPRSIASKSSNLAYFGYFSGKYPVIVESYDSASNLRFDKNAIILRFDSRFDSASNHNTNLIFCFQIKIRFDIRFDVFKN